SHPRNVLLYAAARFDLLPRSGHLSAPLVPPWPRPRGAIAGAELGVLARGGDVPMRQIERRRYELTRQRRIPPKLPRTGRNTLATPPNWGRGIDVRVKEAREAQVNIANTGVPRSLVASVAGQRAYSPAVRTRSAQGSSRGATRARLGAGTTLSMAQFS